MRSVPLWAAVLAPALALSCLALSIPALTAIASVHTDGYQEAVQPPASTFLTTTDAAAPPWSSTGLPEDPGTPGIPPGLFQQGVWLHPSLRGLPYDSTVTVWVYFADKGPTLDVRRELRSLEHRFSQRALARRAKVRRAELVDYRDLPVSCKYLQRLEVMGYRIRAISKWVNAASVRCRVGELPRLYQLPFVRTVRPVASFQRRDIVVEELPQPSAEPVMQEDAASRQKTLAYLASPGDTAFYGATWRQLDLIQVPALHAQGYTGEGMFVGVLDTGFNLVHDALQQVNVVAQWDFINWDSVTANEDGQDSWNQHNHGTLIIGLLAGYLPGTYSGAAFDADYALAKTEVVTSETPVEEDYWVMGIEWLDSLGVDLVSSSLGYIDWYTYEDMNGDSAVTTIAADIAVSNGISVFSAMGNGGLSAYKYVIAPADGDSVMSIGAVDSLGVLWPSSSRGPTFDGRIKPEVVTQGSSAYCVSPLGTTTYTRASGTSCATPLAAGACALILQKNPGWIPMMLRDAARATATNSSSPDTAIGWGILQAEDASDYAIVAVAERPAPVPGVRPAITVENEPNPFNPLTTIHISVTGSNANGRLTATMYDVTGRCVRDFGTLRLTGGRVDVVWDGKDNSGQQLASGVYVLSATAGETRQTRKLLLLK